MSKRCVLCDSSVAEPSVMPLPQSNLACRQELRRSMLCCQTAAWNRDRWWSGWRSRGAGRRSWHFRGSDRPWNTTPCGRLSTPWASSIPPQCRDGGSPWNPCCCCVPTPWRIPRGRWSNACDPPPWELPGFRSKPFLIGCSIAGRWLRKPRGASVSCFGLVDNDKPRGPMRAGWCSLARQPGRRLDASAWNCWRAGERLLVVPWNWM